MSVRRKASHSAQPTKAVAPVAEAAVPDEPREPLPWEVPHTMPNQIYVFGQLIMAMKRDFGLDPAHSTNLVGQVLTYQLNISAMQQNGSHTDLEELFAAAQRGDLEETHAESQDEGTIAQITDAPSKRRTKAD
jgi:hypothetical protein